MSQTPVPAPAPAPALDLNNIQGDILSGLPKKAQVYIFFQITNAAKFRTDLKQFTPLVKTVTQVLKDRDVINDHKKKGHKGLIPMVGVNIAFSHFGFVQMGVDDSSLSSGDTDPFVVGQRNDAVPNLMDAASQGDTTPAWDPAFLQPLHGVILISGDSHDTINKKRQEVEQAFGVHTNTASILEIKDLKGDVRPGDQSGHEHFGFLDGISNPSIIGFDNLTKPPGPEAVNPGILLTGHQDDLLQAQRASWATDGSFLVFRYLFQNVPEFHDYLKKNPIVMDGATPEQGSELLGARIVGRWMSGAPIDVSPLQDDPVLAKDAQRNNNFSFAGEINSQTRCPFAAHIRKSLPRDDLAGPPDPVISIDRYRIMRRGVQFGPEVTEQENATATTLHGRGLLFACYQSGISSGFQFIQKSWANTASFPFKQQTPQVPGLDGLIGQGTRQMTGLDPNHPEVARTLPDFIIPRGGEYFFSPSIAGLNFLATPA